jgi:hypothetical protein
MMKKIDKITAMKMRIIESGYKAVDHLIEVAEEKIIQKHFDGEGDSAELSADKLKNAAATKKIAIFDAFDILNRIEAEREAIEQLEKGESKTDSKKGFAERHSK